MSKTPKQNHQEDALIYRLDIHKYTDKLIKESFQTKLRGFSLEDISKQVANHFNDSKAQDIAWNYYLEKIGY